MAENYAPSPLLIPRFVFLPWNLTHCIVMNIFPVLYFVIACEFLEAETVSLSSPLHYPASHLLGSLWMLSK